MSGLRMNVPLVLETVERVDDGIGGYGVQWRMLGQVFANMDAGSGRAAQAEVGSRSVVTWRITLRGARVGDPRRPKPGQRFRMGSRVFGIDAVAEGDAAGHWLVCTAKEELPA